MPARPTETPPRCPICDAGMGHDVMTDIWRCPVCDYFGSTLPIAINDTSGALDEDRRIEALADIRQENFEIILDQLQAIDGFPRNASALDVGCGHGWFLKALTARGCRAKGIEPDTYIAEIARRAGHDVTIGFFPGALEPEARFDVIFFHDVFEHLPDINSIIESLKTHMHPRGWVVVNLPVSGGIFFRIARSLARIGIDGPYRRLWQSDMPSPHLSYFSDANLEKLFRRHGFTLVRAAALQSIGSKGLLNRIRYDRNIHPLAVYLYYAGALALVPVLRMLPADIKFFVFRRLPDA